MAVADMSSKGAKQEWGYEAYIPINRFWCLHHITVCFSYPRFLVHAKVVVSHRIRWCLRCRCVDTDTRQDRCNDIACGSTRTVRAVIPKYVQCDMSWGNSWGKQ